GNAMRFVMLTSLLLAGCAQASVMPLGDDTFKITAAAAPVCGQQGAERVAFRQAAVETIKRGYDRFRILDDRYQNQVSVVGYTPVVAQESHSGSVYSGGYGSASYYGSSRTYVSGGQPIIAGSHNQGLLVRMYRDGQEGAAGALSAKSELGPKWQEIVKNPIATCTS
ncbi:MAG: hypothetical protein KKB37_01150, partial [Alphaproteobacteria bacterium]|nr:hypothetical protein [Alphaproteobacteria bacterium]